MWNNFQPCFATKPDHFTVHSSPDIDLQLLPGSIRERKRCCSVEYGDRKKDKIAGWIWHLEDQGRVLSFRKPSHQAQFEKLQTWDLGCCALLSLSLIALCFCSVSFEEARGIQFQFRAQNECTFLRQTDGAWPWGAEIEVEILTADIGFQIQGFCCEFGAWGTFQIG